MKNLKNQKGITLVALVVTIIVLLILAGVSLSLVAGSNGIMTRTVAARDKNESATAAERAELAIAEWQMEWYENYYVETGSKHTTDDLKTYLTTNYATKDISGGYEVSITDTTATVKKKGASKNLAEASLTFSNNDRNLSIGVWSLIMP